MVRYKINLGAEICKLYRRSAESKLKRRGPKLLVGIKHKNISRAAQWLMVAAVATTPLETRVGKILLYNKFQCDSSISKQKKAIKFDYHQNQEEDIGPLNLVSSYFIFLLDFLSI